jgi:hypothetical protein
MSAGRDDLEDAPPNPMDGHWLTYCTAMGRLRPGTATFAAPPSYRPIFAQVVFHEARSVQWDSCAIDARIQELPKKGQGQCAGGDTLFVRAMMIDLGLTNTRKSSDLPLLSTGRDCCDSSTARLRRAPTMRVAAY